jgi:hypothetical protein
VGTSSAAGSGFVEESCVWVGAQDYVTGPIYDAGLFCCHVIMGLAGADGTESHQKLVVIQQSHVCGVYSESIKEL